MALPTITQASAAKTDHFLTVMGSKSIGKYSVLANISYFAIGQQDDSKHSRGEWTFAVSRPLRGLLSAVGEVYGDSRLDEWNVPFTTLTWALTYGVNRKYWMQVPWWDLPQARAPGNAAFVGITYAFGTLYRPRHFPAGSVQPVP